MPILIAVILASLVVSSMGHAIQPALYQTFKWLVGVLNRNISALDLESSRQVVLKNHVVLLGFNEIAQEIKLVSHVFLRMSSVFTIFIVAYSQRR